MMCLCRRFLSRGLAAALFAAAIATLHGQEPQTVAPEPSHAQVSSVDILAVSRGGPNAKTAATPLQWRQRRNEIVAAMQSIMGPLNLPEKRQPPAMQVLSEVDCETYVRQKIIYESQPNGPTPAYLCIPKRAIDEDSARLPAVLCLHPTDGKVGHDVVVGLGGKPNRQYASELAERGFVTLAPSYPLMASYQPDLQKLGWESGTLKAVFDNIRGIDLLESMTFVDPDNIAAIGHSLGGHNAIYTAVFDPRIQAVVSSCGLDSYQDYYNGDPNRWLPGEGWTQDRYMPRLAQFRGRLHEIPFDFDEMLAALAPRTVMIIAPLHDSNFRADSVDRLSEAARKVYSLYGMPEKLTVLHPDCQHDFPVEMREKAYRLLEDELKVPSEK